jgi:predicted transcriptional regulator
MKDAIFFRVDPEIKERLQEIARSERRSVASVILLLIDKKIGENKNARTTTAIKS